MTVQLFNSVASWKCTGTSANPHAEVINNTKNCPYCDKSCVEYDENNQVINGLPIPLFISGIGSILAICLVFAAFVYALAQTKDKLQLRERQVGEGSKCVKLIGEINNVIWQGVALNTDEVRLIQQQLKSLGFYQGEIDGTFAKVTRKAVKDFQQDCQVKLN